jgi:hypothetical protein
LSDAAFSAADVGSGGALKWRKEEGERRKEEEGTDGSKEG